MKELIKKYPIYFRCIAIAAFFIFVLFVAACCNHCYVNSNIRKNIDSLSVNFENTKTNIEIITKNISHECTQDKDAENVSHELELLCSNIKGAISEITQLHSKTFDANTVTFLITFLSALLFTVFITLFIKNIEQFNKLYEIKTELDDKITTADNKIAEANNSIAKADTKITEVDAKIKEANDKIAEADTKITEVDAKITEAEKDWNTKLQYQEYLLKVATERNSLTQVLNLVSVLGSQLASNGYIIKEGYPILAYMIFRKTQLVLKEGFKDIKDIRPEDQTEFMQIITDCITYLNIETLEDKNPKEGLRMFTRLYDDLKAIRDKIKKISVSDEVCTSEPSAMALD